MEALRGQLDFARPLLVLAVPETSADALRPSLPSVQLVWIILILEKLWDEATDCRYLGASFRIQLWLPPMPEEVRLWRVEPGDRLRDIPRRQLDLESRIEQWLTQDISILDPDLLVIGRQVETDHRGIIDLLCMDQTGDLVVVELKRDRTPREITAQVLDYGSWVKDLSVERVLALAESFHGKDSFEQAFQQKFGVELPESLNESHRLLVVGSAIDQSSERIIRYLSESYGVNINAATFQFFKDESGGEILARVFLVQPEQVERQTRAKGVSKRRPSLTMDELDDIAQQQGVDELYRHTARALERLFPKDTTRSSLRFLGRIDGGRKAILSLLPGESSVTEGLCFQVYIHRLARMFSITEALATELLPEKKEPWSYYGTADRDFQGFRGFFRSQAEVDRLVASLSEQSGE
jgi:hypothetical protein